MSRLHRYFVVKIIVITLVLVIGAGDTGMYAQADNKDLFAEAVTYYEVAEYAEAQTRLEKILETIKEEELQLKAKVYFLLGACYEKQKNKKEAITYFTRLKDMFEAKLIDGFPTIGDIDPYSLKTYKKIFKEYYKKKDKKKAKNNVIEKTGIKTKKKRGSLAVLIAAGAAALVTLGILLFTKKKLTPNPTPPEVNRPIEWMRVPAGEFLMGDHTGEGAPNSRPVHAVYLDEFHISKYEITFAQYNAFLEETGRPKAYDGNWGSGDIPVYFVTWEDAAAYCRWLSEKNGETIKLPTEAQWEKAARGTDQRLYPWGNDNPTCDLGNFSPCSYQPQKVGTKPNGASPYGAENMAGNVREWCRDWYDENYYAISPYNNPQGPATGTERVWRGASSQISFLDSGINQIRAYYRNSDGPNGWSGYLGFRVVKEN
jgi:formylglycine-generating enzyme required for sulfatase activity